MSDYKIRNGELYHFGVKGMKWGRRRYQSQDGTLTPAGKKRYADDGPRKSRHQLVLEEKYRKSGMSSLEAEQAARKRIRSERVLAAVAATTVTACAAYVIHKKLKERTDGLIKAGDTLQNISSPSSEARLHDMFYASNTKKDNKRYAGLLGLARQTTEGEAYLMELQSTKDIKVASRDKAAKMFGDLYKNDPDFRSASAEYVSKHFAGGNRVQDINDMSSKNIKKMYQNFNVNLTRAEKSAARPDKKFYEKLKSSGYGAIQDVNDMDFSGFNAKNPLIVFGDNNSVKIRKVSKLNGDALAKSGIKEALKANGESATKAFMETLGPMSAMLLTSSAIQTYAEDYQKNPAVNDKKHKR